MRDQGGTGFVGLNDYLGANQDPLNAQFQADSTQAHGLSDTLNGYLGDISSGAAQAARGGTPAPPESVQGFTSATATAQQAEDLGHKFTPNTVGPTAFDSALQWGAHGADYRSLSGYLNGLGQAPQMAYDLGTGQGLAPGKNTRNPNKPHGDLPGEIPPQPPEENPDGPGGGYGTTWTWQDTGGGG